MERINLSRAFRDAADKAEPHVRRNALRAIYAKCPIKFSDDLNIILDPWPYKGYSLFVKGKKQNGGWYFSKLAAADEEFTQWLKNTLSSSADAPEQRPRSSQRKRKAAP